MHDWAGWVAGVVFLLKRKFSAEAESELDKEESTVGDGTSMGNWKERRWWSTLLSTRQSSLNTNNTALRLTV